jgi:gliding motility-associated-like protein
MRSSIKKVLFLCLFANFCLFSSESQAQGVYNTRDWRFSNPIPLGFTVLDVDYLDDNIVIAVGENGGIARSSDGGRTWTYGIFTYTTPAAQITKASFQDVHVVNSSAMYAVGTGGMMAKSTDGGATWSFVSNPLFANARTINSVWFVDANTGYIGGQWNTLDSIPKLYRTINGGASWDSLNAPIGGKTRVGYINNPNRPPLIWDVTAKGKEIQRIAFTSATTGYIIGSGQSHFPPIPAVTAATCLPATTTTSTSANNAALVWKFTNGTLTDYSLSKERLGYSGVVTNNVLCNTQYNAAQIAPVVQTYKALNIINDSLIVIMSFNNNCVVRIHTGRNDVTTNMINNIAEPGRYQIMNFPFPPTQGPQAGPPIPAVQVLLASNPYNILRASNGKLFATSFSGTFGAENKMFTSIDTGRNWVQERNLPRGRNYSEASIITMDISPSGNFIFMGVNGVHSDSIPGSPTRSNYITTPVGASWSKMDFADCNNAIVAGGANINSTRDGGKTWTNTFRADFAASNWNINSVAFPTTTRSYYAGSNGIVYFSPDRGVTMDPILTDFDVQMTDVAVRGDTIWACGTGAFTVPIASRRPKVFRSINGGATWTTLSAPFTAGSTAQSLNDIEFPTHLVGYMSGTRDTIWKTTDGGASWFKLPLPTPGVTPQISYTDLQALDANTVFVTGNGFPRQVVFRTTDGGQTWTNISSNLAALGIGNLNGVRMHDVNNGYVVRPGGFLCKTTNGGQSWSPELAPTGSLFEIAVFPQRTVPTGTPMENRKLFVVGPNLNGAPIMEYGDTTKTNVNITGVTATPSCDNAPTGSIAINATGGIGNYIYTLAGRPAQASNTFTNLAVGTYVVTVQDAFCGITNRSVTVGSLPSPNVNAGPDKIMVDGYPVTLDGSSSTANLASIAWSPSATLVGATGLMPLAKPAATTTYTLTVRGANGCSSSDNVLVTVLPYCIKPMDAFTPNKDGTNDLWLVTAFGGTCVNRVYVNVFNRYGNVVYKNDNYQNNWDGTYSGKPIPDGTYYYVIDYRLINGQSIVLKGDLTIIR